MRSIESQTLYPAQIIIVDGSTDLSTQTMLGANSFKNIEYFQVPDAERGLTRQRNRGISMVRPEMDVVCFLDDDVILEDDYFERLIGTYSIYPHALGVGGYIINESEWVPVETHERIRVDEFAFDGWKRKDGSRYVARKRLGLDSDVPPGFSPEFSHGRSVGFLPPSGNTYPVEQLMGGVSSFRREVFEMQQFSTYFVGYGLYEDADFSLRLAKRGKLFVNTAARLAHYHDDGGRPDKYDYGKMVVRNGYYVWRVKNPKPSFRAKLKWHSITLLLMMIRFTNALSAPRKPAITEALGRLSGYFGILLHPPTTSETNNF